MKATTITRTIIGLILIVVAVGCGTTSYHTGNTPPPVDRRVVIVPGHPYGYGGYYGTNRYRRPPVYYRQQYPQRRPPVIIRERPRVIRQRPTYRRNESRYTPVPRVTDRNSNNRYQQPKPQQNQRPERVYRPSRNQ